MIDRTSDNPTGSYEVRMLQLMERIAESLSQIAGIMQRNAK